MTDEENFQAVMDAVTRENDCDYCDGDSRDNSNSVLKPFRW